MYLGHEQHLDKVPVRHEELGDEVDVVVSCGVSELRGRRLPGPKLVVQVREVQRRALSAVVIVAVHVQDLPNRNRDINGSLSGIVEGWVGNSAIAEEDVFGKSQQHVATARVREKVFNANKMGVLVLVHDHTVRVS